MIKLNESIINWRFTEHSQEEDIRDILVDNTFNSKKIWKATIGFDDYHLMKLPSEFWIELELREKLLLNWGEEDVKNKKKISNLSYFDKQDVISYFIGGSVHIYIKWDIFVKYWESFCYPDDDNIVIFNRRNNVIAVFVEEVLYIYQRKKGV